MSRKHKRELTTPSSNRALAALEGHTADLAPEERTDPRSLAVLGDAMGRGLARWMVEASPAGFQVVRDPLGPYVLYHDIQPDALAEHDKTETLRTLEAIRNSIDATIVRIKGHVR